MNPGLKAEDSFSLMKFAFRGRSYSYWKIGSGDPVVFLHNAGTSHSIWQRQVSSLSSRNTCYLVDLPGYGNSNETGIVYSLEFYIDFLDRLLRQAEITDVTLIGNCLGSAISLRFAMDRSDLVRSLILFHILSPTTVREGLLRPLFAATERVRGSRGFLRKVLGGLVLPKSVGRLILKSQFGTRGNRDSIFEESLLEQYQKKGVVGALGDLLVDIDSFGSLEALKIGESFPKTLVFWGSKNLILPLSGGQDLCRRIGPHQFEVVSGGGHLAMFELAHEVNPVLSEFLYSSVKS